MKKILTTLALVAGTTLIHAQGFIIYNGTAASITTNTSSYYAQGAGTVGKTFGSGTLPGAYTYALLEGGTGAATSGNWTQVSAFGGGVLLGGQGAAPGSLTGPGTTSGVAINVAAGTTVNVLLVGWSSNLGSTWASILTQLGDGSSLGSNWSGNGFFGQTAISTMTPFVTAGAGDPAVFTTMFANGSLQLFAVSPVPEPATIALASLGGLSLLAFRRRNKA